MSNNLHVVRQRLAMSTLVGFQTQASDAPAKNASAKLSVSKSSSPKLGNGGVVKTSLPKVGDVVKTGSPKLGGVVKTL